MNKLASIAKNVGKGISKNSPTILTVMACGGVISTAAFAARAGALADRAICEDEVSRKLTLKEKVKDSWKFYIPTALSGALTIGCIIGSNKISGDRTAAFASIAAASASTLQEYQSKVVEKIGEKKNQQIRDEISTEHAKRDGVKTTEIVITGNGDYLCYDVMSGRYFRSDINKIKRVENDAREELMREMWITLNDVYYMLGLTGTKLGEYVGWDPDNQPYFSFTSMLSENSEPCLCIDYSVRPKPQAFN